MFLAGLASVALQAVYLSGAIAALPGQPPSSGITVSPAYITAQVGSAQRQATASVGVRNNFTVPITVTAVLNGFDIKDNALLPTNRTDSALADIIKFSPAEITIPPQSSRNITVTVTDKASLAPGGHYVSLLITQTAAAGPNNQPQLSLKPAVSATIYVIKEDGAVRSLIARQVKLDGNIFSLPKTVDVEFYNNGNVASVPRGILTITRKGNETSLAQAIVNQDSSPLYQNQATILRANLTEFSNPQLPGRLVAKLDYRSDGQVKSEAVSVNVWYFPPSSLIGLILLAGLIGLLVWPTSRQKILKPTLFRRKTKRKPFVRPDLTNIQKTANNISKPNTLKKRRIDVE